MYQNPWYWLSNKFPVLIVWLLFSSQAIQAQDEQIDLTIKSHRAVNVCGGDSKKRVQISLNIGEVKPSDSLYSYDIILRYDPDVLKLKAGLYINTLAEFFEWKGVNVVEPGFLRVYAANMLDNRVWGDKPLIAAECTYLGECPDTLHIDLEYAEIEVSQETLSKLNFDNTRLAIPVEVLETDTSFVECRFPADSIAFEDDSTASAVIKLNTNNLEGVELIEMSLVYDKNDNIQLLEAQNINEKCVVLSDSTFENNMKMIKKYLIEFTDKVKNESIFDLKFKQTMNRDDIINVDCSVDVLNDCSCATKFYGDELVVFSEKDTTQISVVDYESNDIMIEAFYDDISETIRIRSEEIIDRVEIYNMSGQLIGRLRDIENRSEIDYDLSKESKGVYFISVLLRSFNKENIVLIKN